MTCAPIALKVFPLLSVCHLFSVPRPTLLLLNMNYCPSLSTSSHFLCSLHPTSHHWAISLKLHVFHHVNSMGKDSNDFLLSTVFSPVSVPESFFIQSPLPSDSALIPTAPSPPLPLRHSLPPIVHKDVFLLYICHIKILSGLPDEWSPWNRTHQWPEKGWAGAWS